MEASFHSPRLPAFRRSASIGKRKEVKQMIPRKQKSYWEMSALEKQIKFKDLTPFECYKLHHEEMQKFAQEQIEKQRAIEEKKREAQEQKKLEKQ